MNTMTLLGIDIGKHSFHLHSQAEAVESQDMLDKMLAATSQLTVDAGKGDKAGGHVSLADRFDQFLMRQRCCWRSVG